MAFKLPFLDNDYNDHIKPSVKFYKQKRFWILIVGAVGYGLVGDYTAIIPVATKIFNVLTA